MKSGAPSGIRNGNATVSFKKIEALRKEWRDRPTMQKMAAREGVSVNTLKGWIQYNSRVES
jgi:DNA-binding transcriptional regulator YiaG